MSFLPLNFIFSAPLTIQIAYFVLCLVVAILGRNKTMGFWGYFFGSILLTPVMGLLLVLVAGKKS